MTSTVIRVGSKPAPYVATADYLNGEEARPISVELRIDEDKGALVWEDENSEKLSWLLKDIREVPDQAANDIMVLRHHKDAVRRIILSDRSLEPRLKNRKRRAPVTRRGRLAVWAVASVASVALIVLVLVPTMANQLANFIPAEGERALGDVTLNQIRDALDETGLAPVPLCENPEGLAALNAMETRFETVLDLPTELTVHVLDHKMVNAFALPGGHIVFFRGLFDAADAPEQIAAVFAHEIGHVVSRDPTRHALRSAGSIGVLGLLFGDFAGGAVVLFLAERLIDAQYAQGAEAQADTFAHDAMIKAGLAPSALADMFVHFQARGGSSTGLAAHFLSHPALGDRIEAARNATPKNMETQLILTESQWADLKKICS